MAAGADTLLHYIRRLAIPRGSDPASDAALLHRYLAVKDEGAFALLVHRHGPLVFNVCRRVLGDIHDAEDAFQATFLVLARKAATVHPREALTAWLHGVARRVALKARSARNRRCRERCPLLAPTPDPRPDPVAELSAREVLEIIDEELQRLAEVYRLPVILCCLEGRSLEEAARQLGWTPGSVRARLERGRARLHDRLVRRGLTLSAALAVAEVSRAAVSAAAVAPLIALTVRGAMAFGALPTVASGVSPRAAVLAGETLKGMTLAKLKIAALLLATCLVVTGSLYGKAYLASTAAPQVRSSAPPSEDPVAHAAPAALLKNQSKLLDEADVPIEVSGRVFDPSGKPYAGAKLYLGYSIRGSAPNFQSQWTAYRPRAASGADGQFHLVFTTSELDAKSLDNSRPAVIAVADGYGPDWAQIREPEKRAELSLKLVEDLPLNGRILDQNRQPVAGARVFVLEVGSGSEKGVIKSSQANNGRWRGPLPEQPSSVMTDADGRFHLTGVGRNRSVSLALDGPGIVHASLTAVTRLSAAIPNAQPVNGANIEYQTTPSQSLRGVVRDKATGRPVAGVRVCALQHHPPTFTDENGRFEILGCPKFPEGYAVMVQPQTGQPYFATKVSVPDRPGFDPLSVDIDLLGGIPLSGRVIDQATGKPPRAGTVEYYPLFPNRHSAKLTHCPHLPASLSIIQPDGSYNLAVLPGPGVVCVAASPRNLYAVAVVDEKKVADFFHDQVGGGNQRLQIDLGAGARVNLAVNKYNALSLINPDERAESLALDITLQPGRTVQGTLVGPDGEPLTGVEVVGLTALWDEEMLEGKSFTVTGLNPRCSRELVFRHRGKRLGKLLTVRGDETEPLTVQLEPWGNVLGRVVEKAGKPVPGVYLYFSRRGQSPEVVAKTDRDGHFREALLAGQKYSLWLSGPRRLPKDVGAVEVESGRSIDLGDLAVGD